MSATRSKKDTQAGSFLSFLPPVAIGGLGGSGTRVLAALLQAAGVRIGGCLNASLDNLWFTILFKRAAWAALPTPAIPNPEEVGVAAELFHRAMTRGLGGSLSPKERALLDQLRADLPPGGNWRTGAEARHADGLARSARPNGGLVDPWGWKEPNTHVFLPQLDRHIPGIRYIHMMRDGLDMAFSANTWQARHWSHLYGFPRDDAESMRVRQLRFWNAANRAAIDYGSRHMRERFMVVHYEDLCARPIDHWQRLQEFIGLAPEAFRPLPGNLLQPTTIGRRVGQCLSEFPEVDLAKTRALQSVVERIGQP